MDFHQLELIYKKLYAISLEIKEHILNKDYDTILSIIGRKDPLINQLNQTKKTLDKENIPDFIKNIETKIQKQELENMQNLEKIRDELKKELSKINQDTKILSAYSQNESRSSIIDITE